jgi:hypothetical protein
MEEKNTQNGFIYELSKNSVEYKYRKLWSEIKPISQKLINYDPKANTFVQYKMPLILFEFKVFTYSYFLNKLRVDNSEMFKIFGQTCLSELMLEMEDMVLRATEITSFNIPGHFIRSQEYLLEKIKFYMEDIEGFISKGKCPRYTFVSILKMPFDNTRDVLFMVQMIEEKIDFNVVYSEILELLERRYNFTPE